jgi:hypothetical protein
MEVLIGTQPCASVVVTDVSNLGELTCVAPPGPGFGAVQLRIAVQGSGSGSIRFLYDAPVVTRVEGSPCVASAACPIQVRLFVHEAVILLWARAPCFEAEMGWFLHVIGRPSSCLCLAVLPLQIVGVNVGPGSAEAGPEPIVFIGE